MAPLSVIPVGLSRPCLAKHPLLPKRPPRRRRQPASAAPCRWVMSLSRARVKGAHGSRGGSSWRKLPDPPKRSPGTCVMGAGGGWRHVTRRAFRGLHRPRGGLPECMRGGLAAAPLKVSVCCVPRRGSTRRPKSLSGEDRQRASESRWGPHPIRAGRLGNRQVRQRGFELVEALCDMGGRDARGHRSRSAADVCPPQRVDRPITIRVGQRTFAVARGGTRPRPRASAAARPRLYD